MCFKFLNVIDLRSTFRLLWKLLYFKGEIVIQSIIIVVIIILQSINIVLLYVEYNVLRIFFILGRRDDLLILLHMLLT